MGLTLPSDEEMNRISEAGRAIYDDKLKATLEPEHNGKVVAIHLDSEDYELARNSPTASKALRARRPTGLIYVTDVGPARMDSLTYRMLANHYLAGPNK